MTLIIAALAETGDISPLASTQAPSQSKCYDCYVRDSTSKSEACFVLPETATKKTCTKNTGCFIKRREETDEYGDVTK